MLNHQETVVVRRHHWSCVSYGNKKKVNVALNVCGFESLSDKEGTYLQKVVCGIFMQYFVRRQWHCMFFFECKCTLLRFFF